MGRVQEGVWLIIRGGRKFKVANVLVIAALEMGVYLLGFPSLGIASVSSFLSYVDLPMIVI